jgi:rare lipoprotein A
VGLVLLGAASSVAAQPPDATERPAKASAYSAIGYASWYGREFHGRRTADGETFDMGGLTAAHKTMPLPCYARVTNLGNGRSILVRVNDRGPFVGERLIDVSAHVADLLDFRRSGLTKVKVDYVGMAPPNGGDGQVLLASLKTRDAPEDGVSAFAPTPPTRAVFAQSGALAAANRVALGPPRLAMLEAPPPRDNPPPSPYGDLVPTAYGDIPPWPVEPSASPALMAEIRP